MRGKGVEGQGRSEACNHLAAVRGLTMSRITRHVGQFQQSYVSVNSRTNPMVTPHPCEYSAAASLSGSFVPKALRPRGPRLWVY